MIVNNFMLQPHERGIIENVKRENHRLVIDRALPPLSLSELQYKKYPTVLALIG